MRRSNEETIREREGENTLASSPPRLLASSPLLALVGPTAVGKTAFSLQIAQDYNGEIISADSRQIYRGLDIGAAKATPEQQALAPHHLLDVVTPDQILTLAEFQERAYATIAAIHARQRLPILVGGTGQWVQAVVEGWGVPRVPPDPELRAALEAEAETIGSTAFHARLAAVDPQAAQKLDPRNVRRVIRALEVYHKTGIPISQHQQKNAPPYHILQLGLTMPREALYQRVDQRIDRMLEMGLVAEVERLVKAGYGWDLPAMSGLGYKQIGYYLRGELSLEEVVALIKKETRRYVRQQYNWFRLDNPRITWVEVGQEPEQAYREIKRFLDEAVGREKN
ncbi:MAG: tRNA (adenosine(37)-N6)-dimethylallyltransferase MiaA [Anaerolineales bacterium]|nr:tRNA (adenosine(37)-N6)-dimethylallyltransferase MiaA [Anaerolineales bacterium]